MTDLVASSGSAGTWKGVFILRDRDGKPKFDDPHNVPEEILKVLSPEDLEHLEILKGES